MNIFLVLGSLVGVIRHAVCVCRLVRNKVPLYHNHYAALYLRGRRGTSNTKTMRACAA